MKISTYPFYYRMILCDSNIERQSDPPSPTSVPVCRPSSGSQAALVFDSIDATCAQVIENIFKLRDGEAEMEIVGDMRASLIDEMA